MQIVNLVKRTLRRERGQGSQSGPSGSPAPHLTVSPKAVQLIKPLSFVPWNPITISDKPQSKPSSSKVRALGPGFRGQISYRALRAHKYLLSSVFCPLSSERHYEGRKPVAIQEAAWMATSRSPSHDGAGDGMELALREWSIFFRHYPGILALPALK